MINSDLRARPQSYGAVPDRISSTLIGVAVTTILFLSGISFSIQKGNVIESSLMLALRFPSLLSWARIPD